MQKTVLYILLTLYHGTSVEKATSDNENEDAVQRHAQHRSKKKPC